MLISACALLQEVPAAKFSNCIRLLKHRMALKQCKKLDLSVLGFVKAFIRLMAKESDAEIWENREV